MSSILVLFSFLYRVIIYAFRKMFTQSIKRNTLKLFSGLSQTILFNKGSKTDFTHQLLFLLRHTYILYLYMCIYMFVYIFINMYLFIYIFIYLFILHQYHLYCFSAGKRGIYIYIIQTVY